MLKIEEVRVTMTQMGFALLLITSDSDLVVPIFIGSMETFSISGVLEDKASERPLSHDLMHEMLNTLGYHVSMVCINDFHSGTFFARLNLINTNLKKEFEFDSRPSDAIALALRFKAPIYIDKNVFDKAAIEFSLIKEADNIFDPEEPIFEDEKDNFIQSIIDDFTEAINPPESTKKKPKEFKDRTEVLRQMLEVAIQEENYEDAADIRDELNKLEHIKKKGNPSD